MLELKNFACAHQGTQVLKEVNTSIPKGSLVALLGNNGSGKSTLLRSLIGLHSEWSGEMIVHGTHGPITPSKKEARRLSKEISVVFSKLTYIPDLSIQECLETAMSTSLPFFASSKKSAEEKQRMASRITELLNLVSLHSGGKMIEFDRKLDTLSDGELKKVLIARALAQETPMILMDEPLSHLDHLSKSEILQLLSKLKTLGKTILFSTHDLHYLGSDLDQILLLSKGGLKELPGGSTLLELEEMLLAGKKA
jgi:iron complex transport system ATP-binding protein